jgi:hypothetical protein
MKSRMNTRMSLAMSLAMVLAAWSLGAGTTLASPIATTGPAVLESAVATTLVVGSDWVVKTENSVVGVSQARQITNPAKVDYDKLMKATPEMKKLRKEGIEESSARGQTLVTAAQSRIRRVARTVMTEKSHCSIWKKISHKKGTAVTDLTDTIKKKLAE